MFIMKYMNYTKCFKIQTLTRLIVEKFTRMKKMIWGKHSTSAWRELALHTLIAPNYSKENLNYDEEHQKIYV